MSLPPHTMYIDKPMRGHGLMQAIACVNRVFRDNRPCQNARHGPPHPEKYGNSSDLQEAATQTVLEQAEVLCAE